MADIWDKPRPDASDRCDRCGAQAWVVTEAFNTVLKWCVHHWHQFEVKLLPDVTGLYDYSWMLEEE